MDMSAISHIIIPNLERRADKRYFVIGALYASGYRRHDPTKLEIYPAYDGEDYESEEEVRERAVADGFAAFKYPIRCDSNYQKPGFMAAWAWTWCSVLRYIAEKPEDETVLFLIDDIIPMPEFPWRRLVGIVGDAMYIDRRSNFLGVQFCTDTRKHLYWPYSFRGSSILKRGWIGISDNALVLTPACAGLMLRQFNNLSNESCQVVILHDVIKEMACNYREGLWHTVTDVFMNTRYFNSDLKRG